MPSLAKPCECSLGVGYRLLDLPPCEKRPRLSCPDAACLIEPLRLRVREVPLRPLEDPVEIADQARELHLLAVVPDQPRGLTVALHECPRARESGVGIGEPADDGKGTGEIVQRGAGGAQMAAFLGNRDGL